MRELTVEGGWYGDARPDGEYAVQVLDTYGPSHIETAHIETLPMLTAPDGSKDGMLYIRIPTTGPFKFAAQSWKGQGTVEYTNGKGYRVVTPYSYGMNPVIYDEQGDLKIATPQAGSGGFRYVDELGRLITGDQTANPETLWAHMLGVSGLWEWTRLGGVTVGQGQEGCTVVFADTRYQLEPGNCANIRFSMLDQNCAVTIVKPLERKTKLYWFNVEEIVGLPREPVPVPVQPVPVPVPEDQMFKPEVTVDHFAFTKNDHLSDGEKLLFHDRENKSGAVVRVWVEGGSMRMSIEYPGVGVGMTGAKREVR